MAAAWAARVFSGDLSTDSCFVSRMQGLAGPPALAWVPAGQLCRALIQAYYTD